MSAFIIAIGTASPANKYSQNDLAEFMCNHIISNQEEKKKLKILYRATGIQHRYSVLDDYKKSLGTFTFYPNNKSLQPAPSTKQRMAIYREKALPLAIEAITDCLGSNNKYDDFTHIITISCTGMYAPGLDVDIIKALNLSSTIRRNSLNFMGCYAAINAISMAKDICDSQEDCKVLVVSVELCSIHLQLAQTEDNLLAHSLFSDGAAALVVSGQKKSNQPALEIEQTASALFIEGQNDMAWQIGNHGFQMALTTYVPNIIESGIHQLTSQILSKSQITIDSVDAFAIHPGGKKILEAIEKQLKLTKEQNYAAYYILKNYGNMSSPTILFVLKKVWGDLKNESNKNILSFAFGPGLTLESVLFKTT